MLRNITPYTREELLGLPVKRRKEYLLQVIQDILGKILQTAEKGKTSYFIDATFYKSSGSWHTAPPRHEPTPEELRDILKEYFPDSKISYEEVWLETSQNIKERKMGITIDWS